MELSPGGKESRRDLDYVASARKCAFETEKKQRQSIGDWEQESRGAHRGIRAHILVDLFAHHHLTRANGIELDVRRWCFDVSSCPYTHIDKFAVVDLTITIDIGLTNHLFNFIVRQLFA